MEAVLITSENLAAAFDEVAPRYDLIVALNPGYHRHLRAAADALVERLPGSALANGAPPVRILDLGCGSGASTRAVQRAAEAADLRFNVVGVDASAGMIEQARAKSWPVGVRFEVGQAERIASPRASLRLDDHIDGAFAAYLFR
jgi:ubiquinone/menaquinone biosynthesis C-methylase UbiE